MIDTIATILAIAILISPFFIIYFIIKAIRKSIKKRKLQHLEHPKQQNTSQKREYPLNKREGEGETWYSTGWTLNKNTGLWEPPDNIKSNTTYHYTKEEVSQKEAIPKRPSPPQQDRTTSNATQEPKTEPQIPKSDGGYRYVKTDLPKDEFRPGNPPVQNKVQQPKQKASNTPQIIYTYAKPELRPEDREDASPELDFKSAYQRKQLFTRNEWQNYKKLREIAEVRGFVICPKVRLFDLVEPRHDKKKKLTYRYKIQAKHVDFVICDRDMNIKAILELDDSSHYEPERIKRDEFVNTILLATGYTIIHTKYIDSSILDMI